MTVAEEIQAEKALAESLEKYAGRWVAVVDHAITLDAARLEDLLEQIESRAIEVDAVFQVAEDTHAPAFF